MEIGLLFGSFNPIHMGHLIIANAVLNELPLSKIWFIVSPQNPLKKNSALLHADKRLMLVEKAIESDQRFSTSDVEFNLPVPSYTINTLMHLEKKYPENKFYLIMGSDSFLDLKKWKNYETLLRKNIIVYERPGFIMSKTSFSSNIISLKSPLLDISATEIRTLIKAGKSIRYLVPENIILIIENQLLYK